MTNNKPNPRSPGNIKHMNIKNNKKKTNKNILYLDMSHPNYKIQKEKLLKKARKGGKPHLQKDKGKDDIKASVQKTENKRGAT